MSYLVLALVCYFTGIYFGKKSKAKQIKELEDKANELKRLKGV